MNKLLLFTAIITIPILSFGQYCNSGGPSQTADSSIESLSLFGASGSINYTGCPGVVGVEEYLVETAYLNAGGNYTANIQFGTCGGNYSGAGEAWIDFNQNFIFEPSESIGTWTGTPPVAMSAFNFTVPAGATTGPTRMRVIQQEFVSPPLDPCASFSWGSVTDFSIYIDLGIDCSPYIGDDFNDPRMVGSIPYTENYDNSVCYTNVNMVYNSPDVYYLITPLAGITSLDVSLCGSAFDTFLTVTDASGNPIVINDDYAGCGTSSQLSVLVDGADSLYVIVEGWGFAVGAYTININVGTLDNIELDQEVYRIYPNPSQSSFQIGNNFEGDILILDANGRTLLNKSITANESIEATNLPRGLYFVHLISHGRSSVQKLILN